MMLRVSLAALAALLVICSLSAAAVPAAGGTVQAGPDCGFPYTAQDATGADVTVEDRPDRIVVLGASTAQTVWALDAADRVVGAPVDSTTSYLEGIEDTEDVYREDRFTVNQEAVVELDADVLLAPNVIPDETVASLRDANQTVYKFRFGTSLEFIAGKTAETGRLIGACEAATGTNEAFNATIEEIEAGTDDYDSPRVMYFTDNVTAGGGTFVHSLLTTAGGTNVAAENGVQGYGEINEEALVEWNPEVIVVSGVEGGVPDTPAYRETYAVQHDQVVTVDANYVSQPGPRVVIALATMADAFANATVEGQATPTPSPTATATDGGEPTETAQGDGAGFGFAVALVAMLSVALFARRR